MAGIALAALAGCILGLGIAAVLDQLYSDARITWTLHSPLTKAGLLGPALAVVYAIAAVRAVNLRHFVLMALFAALLAALTATDFERHLLPDRMMLPALVAGIALSWLWPGRGALAGIEGGALGLAVMFVIFLVLPGFGFGDVKLAALIGLIVGVGGVLPALLTGAVLGGIGAAFLLLTRRAKAGTAIAYGPYLAGGAVVEMLLRR